MGLWQINGEISLSPPPSVQRSEQGKCIFYSFLIVWLNWVPSDLVPGQDHRKVFPRATSISVPTDPFRDCPCTIAQPLRGFSHWNFAFAWKPFPIPSCLLVPPWYIRESCSPLSTCVWLSWISGVMWCDQPWGYGVCSLLRYGCQLMFSDWRTRLAYNPVSQVLIASCMLVFINTYLY